MATDSSRHLVMVVISGFDGACYMLQIATRPFLNTMLRIRSDRRYVHNDCQMSVILEI